MRNFEAIRKVRDKIHFESEKHDQDVWGRLTKDTAKETTCTPVSGTAYVTVECETPACVAGWAVSQAGEKLLFPNILADTNDWWADSVIARRCLTSKGEIAEIPQRAKKLLGLTDAQAKVLFAGEWSNEETVENLDILLKEDVSNREATKLLRERAETRDIEWLSELCG